MASKTERIAEHLARGLTPAQVSEIVGCTPALISQLQKDERFAIVLEAAKTKLQAEPPTEDILLTDKYNSMEHRLLNQMEKAAEGAELPALTAALRVVGERQEKRALRLATPKDTESRGVVINISLPAHAIPEIELNKQREVTSIGGKALAPMSSEGVRMLFKNINADNIIEMPA